MNNEGFNKEVSEMNVNSINSGQETTEKCSDLADAIEKSITTKEPECTEPSIDITNDYSKQKAEENDYLTELSDVDLWIQKNSTTRQPEVDCLDLKNKEFPISINENGDLLKPFNIKKWTFLLVLSDSFPHRTKSKRIPCRVYLVNPPANSLIGKIPDSITGSIRCDSSGEGYIDFGTDAEEEYERYHEGCSDSLMCDFFIRHTKEWKRYAQKALDVYNQSNTKKMSFWPFQNYRKQQDYYLYYDTINQRPKYTEGRNARGGVIHPRCKKVVLSDRAFIQIYNESRARIQTETGGLLLGHFDKGVWYVVEASDPGINAKFYGAYHEGDDVYENHVCGVISRTYKHPLVFLGMWHRHPGSLDTFSGTDDNTNFKYAGSAGNGCISAIVNYDPDFRITFYYVEQGGPSGVLYTCVDVEFGNDKFINPEMMQIASVQDVLSRKNN